MEQPTRDSPVVPLRDDQSEATEPTIDAKLAKEIASKRYNALAPRFWHGMTLTTWFRLLAHGHFRVSPTRIPTAVSISGFALFNSAMGLAQRLLYKRKIENTDLPHPPLFILGHWRSGTTFLHELLRQDQRLTFPTTCQCFAAPHFLLTESMITRWFNFVMPDKRPMDNMAAGWNNPQEDEFALINLGLPSPYLMMAFPNQGPTCEDYLTLNEVSDDARTQWTETLVLFLKQLSVRDARRVVLKSPPHTARVGLLKELFPGAQFIHIVRDPFTVYSSTMRTWRALNQVQGLQVPKDEEWLQEYVLSTFETMYRQYDQDRKLLDETELIEIKYEELTDNPLTTVESIYAQLKLPDFEETKPAIIDFIEATRKYKTSSYNIEDDVKQSIVQRWFPYLERYGYTASQDDNGK